MAEPTMRAGRYTLRLKLGAGGMGEVWLATDEGPHGYRKTVVIKRMLPEAARFLEYFTAEAKLGARLVHQNIVQVLDFFEEGDKRNIVMEYVEGASVLDLNDRHALTPEQAAYLASQALKGLEFAHNATIDGKPANIVHRDLSPDNILVSCDAEVKVSDFGIAKANVAWRKETEVGFKGKWGYVSPEALLGKEIDRRADVYAMGIVLYEMLARRRAFPQSSSAYHMTARIVEGKIEPLAQVAPHVPAQVVAIVEDMIRPDREQRMPSAAKAREALLRAVPEGVHAERSIAEMVQAISAKRRRITSPFLRPNEEAQLSAGAPGPADGIVMSAAPDQVTVKQVAKTKPESPVGRQAAAPRSVVDPAADTERVKSEPVPAVSVSSPAAPVSRRWWVAGAAIIGAIVSGLGLMVYSGGAGRAPAFGPSSEHAGPMAAPPNTTVPATNAAAGPSPPVASDSAPPKPPSVTLTKSSSRHHHHDELAVVKSPPAAPVSRPATDEPGKIVVRGSAGVTVDGVYIGKAPLEYEISPGRHEVGFSGAEGLRRIQVEPRARVNVDAPGAEPLDARTLCKQAQAAYGRKDLSAASSLANQCLMASTTPVEADDARRVLGYCRCALKDKDGALRVARAVKEQASLERLRTVCSQQGIEIP